MQLFVSKRCPAPLEICLRTPMYECYGNRKDYWHYVDAWLPLNDVKVSETKHPVSYQFYIIPTK